MLNIPTEPIFTRRLELRRTRIEDATAIFQALRDPLMYHYVPRSAPANVSEVEQRFARVIQETAPDRLDQWLNWTVWLRDGGAGLGTIEATVKPGQRVEIGYLFDPRVWRRGFAREGVGAMIEHLSQNGAASFEAVIDIRNIASKALVTSLEFTHAETRGLDEYWRRA
ncbi:MAG: GNAT family N-acetyltransferase [Alphaproteobacteria bacterium]|nr:GNAT family N-acetyltransferase [Alphaproteobacteria bacterium]